MSSSEESSSAVGSSSGINPGSPQGEKSKVDKSTQSDHTPTIDKWLLVFIVATILFLLLSGTFAFLVSILFPFIYHIIFFILINIFYPYVSVILFNFA